MLSKNSRILVIDDFELVRMMVKRCLNQLGYERVEEATDGSLGLRMIHEARNQGDAYALVFADWNMPNMTGLALLQACRSIPEYKRLPFIMVTAEGERSSVVQALAAGATDYIVKPFNEEALSRKIEKIAARLNRVAA